MVGRGGHTTQKVCLRSVSLWSYSKPLWRAVAELGQSWEKVSLQVGRMSSDCRDRYRNHIQNREIRKSGTYHRSYQLKPVLKFLGPWSQEEEELLTSIVTDMTIRQGKDLDNDVFWGKVSELMGGRRGRQQCRIKWWEVAGTRSYEWLRLWTGLILSVKPWRVQV